MDLDGLLHLYAAATPDQRARFLAGLNAEEAAVVLAAVNERNGLIDPLAHLTPADWCSTVFPAYFARPFAPHHLEFWAWLWAIGADTQAPDPFAALWPRGHGKSLVAETAAVVMGCRSIRSYGLYVCGTQDLADDHVANIAGMLESAHVERYYPAMSDRALNKFGNAKGWRRNRLRTASGYTVDALGLDTAARGKRLDEQRPGFMILDDIDEAADSVKVAAKKLQTIANKLLQAVTDDAVIMVAQNLIHPGSVANAIARRETDVLAGAIRSGPFPAVRNLHAEVGDDGLWNVISGEPTWDGMGLADCQARLRRVGWLSFDRESQQNVDEAPGALLKREEIDRARVTSADVPELDRRVVAVDPNKTGRGDDAGVVVVGRGQPDGQAVKHSYTLADFSDLTVPSEWRDVAVRAAHDYNCGAIIVERTGLGEHAELTLKGSPLMQDRPVKVTSVDANTGSKSDRARPVAQFVREGRHHMVGHWPYLERQWTSWDPEQSTLSPGGVDAETHGVTHLLIDAKGAPRVAVAS